MRLLSSVVALALLAAVLLGQGPVGSRGGGTGGGAQEARFVTADVYVDSGRSRLAAWQVEVVGAVEGGTVELVGVEGGEAGAFERPSYYDPAALAGDRVVLAAFTTRAEGLPVGKTRVARVHVRVMGHGDGVPVFRTKLIAAADADGVKIDAATTATREDDRP